MGKQTPRQSKRIRERNQQSFEMPSREKVLDKIEASPYKNLDQLRPKKLINNYIVENYRYNNNDLPPLSDDSELEEFIDSSDDNDVSPKRKRCTDKENIGSSGKKSRRQKVVMYSSDDEDQLLEKRRSERISRQPKKEFKYDKQKALDRIFEREPDLKQVIDSDDADSFVCGDDVEEFESQETGTEDGGGNTDGTEQDYLRDGGVEEEPGSLNSEVIYLAGQEGHVPASPDSACREVVPPSGRVGRHLTGKNISPVDLSKRQVVSDPSSDTDVINVSSAESHTGDPVNCPVVLDEGANRADTEVSGGGTKFSDAVNSLLKVNQGREDCPGPSARLDASELEDKSLVLGRATDRSIESHVDTVQHIDNKINTSKGSGNCIDETNDKPECSLPSNPGNQSDEPNTCSPVAEPNRQNASSERERNNIPCSFEEERISSDSDSEIRTNQALRSKVHRRKQLSKALDSGAESSEDSEEEINTSFALRQKREKRKSVQIDSCSEDDDDDVGDLADQYENSEGDNRPCSDPLPVEEESQMDDDSDSRERTEQTLSSEVHPRQGLSKCLDSEEGDSGEDSGGDINASFTQRLRREKRKSVAIDSGSDDD